jgi:hypothetical protein
MLRLPDFQTIGTWWWQGYQPYAPAAFTPQEVFLVIISVRDLVDPGAIVWTAGSCQWKIPVTPSGIEPTTFRFVAQCLNQLRPRLRPSSPRGSFTTLTTPVPSTRRQDNFHLRLGWSEPCVASECLSNALQNVPSTSATASHVTQGTDLEYEGLDLWQI